MNNKLNQLSHSIEAFNGPGRSAALPCSKEEPHCIIIETRNQNGITLDDDYDALRAQVYQLINRVAQAHPRTPAPARVEFGDAATYYHSTPTHCS